jgi:glycosyltransferase involved in cell wall biosynthesis
VLTTNVQPEAGVPARPALAEAWIIVPAYNEQKRLGGTLESLCRLYRNVVVVDDGSADETARVAEGYPVWILRHPVNCGQGAALQTGIDFALAQGAEVLVTFDADGQHSAAEIELLVEPVGSGAADVALGSRFLGATVGLPFSRRLVLKMGVLFTRVFSGIRVTDTHNGLRAFSRSAARHIHITQNRMAHASEILDQIRQAGLRFVEVPVTVSYSADTLVKGQSSWNAIKIVFQLLLGRVLQ